MERDVFTVTEVAEELGIKPGAVRDAIARGKIEAIRTGGHGQRAGHLLIMRDQIEKYRQEYRGKRGKYPRRRTEPKTGDTP
jgi:excisionase family DNA binding protein